MATIPGTCRRGTVPRGEGLLTKVLALEPAEYGITVHSVAPGEIATPMTGQEDTDPRGEPRRTSRSAGRDTHARWQASERLTDEAWRRS